MKSAAEKIDFVVSGLVLLVIAGGSFALVSAIGPGWALAVAAMLAVAILALMLFIMSSLAQKSIADTICDILKFTRILWYGKTTPQSKAVHLNEREFSMVRLFARCLANPAFCAEQIVNIKGGEWFAELILRTPNVKDTVRANKRLLLNGGTVPLATYRNLPAVYLGCSDGAINIYYPRSIEGIEFVGCGMLFDARIKIGSIDKGVITLTEYGRVE